MDSTAAAYDEIYSYAIGRPGFILQHVVDAGIVQSARLETTKPIAVFFGLAGLYLRVEHGFSGREIQRTHQQLAEFSKSWPPLPLPAERGELTAEDVLAIPPGEARDRAIDDWCRAVWQTMAPLHEQVVSLLAQAGVLPARQPAPPSATP